MLQVDENIVTQIFLTQILQTKLMRITKVSFIEKPETLPMYMYM